MTRVCGAIGDADSTRVAAMAKLAGVWQRERRAHAVLFGSAACSPRADPTGPAWAWTVDGSRRAHSELWQQAAVDGDMSGLVLNDDGAVTLHTSVSGVQPLFVEVGEGVVYFATDLSWLADTATRHLRADWDAWAQILALGAPVNGRTPFQGIRRLRPMEYLEYRDGTLAARTERWPWLDVDPEHDLQPADLTDELLEALRAQIAPHLDHPVHPLLSGGRDSRLLTVLTRQLKESRDGITTWTTSSDIGTSMEELVAIRVAKTLGLDYRVVAPRHDEYATDMVTYARSVSYQASFHTWLMPLANQLGTVGGRALDGLGGGVFIGGGFADADDASGAKTDARFARMARYLQAGGDVFGTGMTEPLRERSRAGFAEVAEPLADHPQGATLTAYLTRTLPGISLGPASVLGGVRPTAMPFISDQVVSRALRIRHSAKRDGTWYPELLRNADPVIGQLPTAADLSKRRHHIRRGANEQAAQWYRELLLNSPVVELLAPALTESPADRWVSLLNKTRPQHLLRSLAMLALWLHRYGDLVVNPDLSDLGGLGSGGES